MSPHERRRWLYLIFFVIGSLLWAHRIVARTDWAQLRQMDVRLEALDAALERARLLIARSDSMEAQLTERVDTLRPVLVSGMAPAESPLAWARSRIQRAAAISGFEPEGMNPIINPFEPWSGVESSDRGFGVFALRLDASGTYPDMLRFVQALETGDPFATLSSLTLYRSSFDEPGQIRFTMVWEWPCWRDTPDALRLRGLFFDTP